MNEIIPFSYESTQVRVLDIDGEPWFVASDALEILGVDRTSLRGLDEDEKGVDSIHTLGGVQGVTVISESGLYSLILRSRKPEAKTFKRWITHEVIPSIRKTGTYGVPQLTGPELMATALIEAQSMLEAKDRQIAELAPRAEYVDTFVADDDLRLFRNVAKSLGVTEMTLRHALIEHKWIYIERSSRWSNSQGKKIMQYRYSPYAHTARYFAPVPNHEAPRFKGEVDHTLKITPAGAVAIARVFAKWGITADKEIAA